MKCSYCVTYNHKSKSKFVSGCESLRLDNVRSHEISDDHKISHTSFLNANKAPCDQPIIKAVINMEKRDLDIMAKLFTTAFYIGKHEKPYTDFIKLNELQNKNYSDNISKHYNSDKQARNFIKYIAQPYMEKQQ
ncbi:hypothetical protein SNE40_009725 [Patella caerulea]|uniref:C17orf113 probable zinc finger domain-containing protein n=1 Tax=Patella caerulea TaxID=87958 RepID=A0AAN8PSD6_PATCE